MLTRYFVIACVHLFFLSHAVGQSQPVAVLTVNNGLAGGNVECGLYDSRGYIWLATAEGLQRYDGDNVVTYLLSDKNSSKFESAGIKVMAEDRIGRLFFGGNNLQVFLPETGKFELIDSNECNHIWLLESARVGIARHLFSGDSYVVFSLDSLGPLRDSVSYPREAKTFLNTAWRYNTHTYHKGEAKWVTHSTIDRGELLRFIRTDGYDLWVGSAKPGGFIYLGYDSDTARWIPLQSLDHLVQHPASLIFMNYNDSSAIAGVEGYGLILFNKHNGRIIRHWDFSHNPSLSRFTVIKPLFTDPAGRVWFCIMPYGVFVIDPMSPRFQKLQNDIHGSLLHHGLMRSMTCDKLNRLWIGYQDGYIQILDSTLQNLIYEENIIDVPYVSDRAVNSIISLPGGDILINGQLRFHIGKNARDIPLPLDQRRIPIPRCSAYNTLSIPSKIAVISDEERLDLYLTDRIVQFNDSVGMNLMTWSYLTERNFLLTHLSQNYLRLFRIDGERVRKEKHFDYNLLLRYVFECPGSDSLWLVSSNGLQVLDLCDFEISEVNTDAWPSKSLYSFVPDATGAYWISSNAGIIRYHTETGAWKCFDINDGMQSNEFNTNCFARMHDGTLVFGGPDGLNAFDPEYFESKTIPFNVYLHNVKVHEQDITGFNPFISQQHISLSPDQKSIEFEYTCTQYFSRDGVDYYIQLVGVDQDWVNRGEKTFVRYVGLSPGNYTFRLKAQNADGLWSTNTLEAGIRVIPAFHQTRIFTVLWILALAGILCALYQYRITQLRKLQQIRNRISRDLHDDVGSTLGSISIYSEVAKSASEEKRSLVLEKIGVASREMLEKLNDLVWSINPENDRMEKMEARMRSYAFMVLNPKGITFHLTIDARDDQVLLDMEKRRNLFLIFKEAIFNAAKYAECSEVHATIKEKDGKISMEIVDNGKGFNPVSVQAYNGHGMRNMRERAIAMRGDLKVNSSQGKGTQIILEVN